MFLKHILVLTTILLVHFSSEKDTEQARAESKMVALKPVTTDSTAVRPGRNRSLYSRSIAVQRLIPSGISPNEVDTPALQKVRGRGKDGRTKMKPGGNKVIEKGWARRKQRPGQSGLDKIEQATAETGTYVKRIKSEEDQPCTNNSFAQSALLIATGIVLNVTGAMQCLVRVKNVFITTRRVE